MARTPPFGQPPQPAPVVLSTSWGAELGGEFCCPFAACVGIGLAGQGLTSLAILSRPSGLDALTEKSDPATHVVFRRLNCRCFDESTRYDETRRWVCGRES